jgi:hypothetical protein
VKAQLLQALKYSPFTNRLIRGKLPFMNRELLNEILYTQKTDLIKNQEQYFITRDIDLMPHLEQKEITIITGVRRSGKSS